MGYTRGQERQKLKSKKDACHFIRKTIFESGDSDTTDTEEDEIFSFDKHMDLKGCAMFPTVTNTDEESIKRFLSHGGLQLTDRQQIALVRALTSFNSVFQTDMYLNRGEKCLTG